MENFHGSTIIRTCNVCNKTMNVESFPYKNKAKGVRNYTCIDCSRTRASERRRRTELLIDNNILPGESRSGCAIRIGNLPTLEQLKNYCFIDDNQCWNWKKSKSRGYGVFAISMGSGYGSVSIPAHRVAFYIAYGSITSSYQVSLDSMVIDHTCGNRACINPDHLEEVLQSENMRRAANYHCPGCQCSR